MKKKTSAEDKRHESEALKLHREAYEKRLRKLQQLDEPAADKAADDSEETEREKEEEALLTNA